MPFHRRVGRLVFAETGQDAAEYALLVGLIAVVIVAAALALGGNMGALYGLIAILP